MTVQQVRVQDLAKQPPLTAICPGYELGQWRTEEMASDVFSRHLPSFALSFTDWSSITGDTAARMLKKAAQAVYGTEKYKRRGEFGELLLHGVVKDFFHAEPAISKIHFKDSANDTVKGFDCVHLIENDGEVELWLGEVKYYTSVNSAIRDCAAELRDHIEQGFLRNEFVAIVNKLDPNWPYSTQVASMLHQNRSLDQILNRIVIPAMLTYDSRAVSSHSILDEAYIKALEAEAEAAWERFCDALPEDFPISLHLILLPLDDKKSLTDALHEKLRTWQGI
ncbi:DUF1837 domain-containing protein [Isoptericola haloaureus]|uniref:DUF1837 domain-containing protein n=1 Tax=Isoptericola haloaureus TaxID=1542902 RepID=A0ABU7Z7C5_9MICO